MHGANFVGGRLSSGGDQKIEATNPATGEPLEGLFVTATAEETDEAVRLAKEAFALYRAVTVEARAAFLEAIADEIVAIGDPLLERAQSETGLPLARLTGERGRTVGQLRMFAAYIREGSWVQARIDPALPDRKPLPRADIRRMLIPIGPVAVFGASNFPFAFSVAGGDTASALAAGCPVVVKAHPAHPGVSELTAAAVIAAAQRTGMPNGAFSMLHGGKETGVQLVSHPLLQAVGFTGSLGAGRALFDAAARRPRPIPVYAEMGSVNPVFILPHALAERTSPLAAGLAQSITLGVGQFCTNPGIVVGVAGPELETLRSELGALIAVAPPGVMLTPGISKAYAAGVDRLASTDGVSVIGKAGVAGEAPKSSAYAALFATDADGFINGHDVAEENFGPSSVLVTCDTKIELEAVANAMEGQLTATVHGTAVDFAEHQDLIHVLETKVGRLIFNGYPTGVEVGHAMQHGGPYPSTTDSRSTSVGTDAIDRFVRPICYQDMPANQLPVELDNANSRNIMRLVDGVWTRDPIAL